MLCEKNFHALPLESRAHGRGCEAGQSGAAALGMGSLQHRGSLELDAHVRALSEAMARHELELSRLVLAFVAPMSFRRLGYATESLAEWLEGGGLQMSAGAKLAPRSAGSSAPAPTSRMGTSTSAIGSAA